MGLEQAKSLARVEQSVDQRMPECGVGFRQLRTCHRTRPGSLPLLKRLFSKRQLSCQITRLAPIPIWALG